MPFVHVQSPLHSRSVLQKTKNKTDYVYEKSHCHFHRTIQFHFVLGKFSSQIQQRCVERLFISCRSEYALLDGN